MLSQRLHWQNRKAADSRVSERDRSHYGGPPLSSLPDEWTEHYQNQHIHKHAQHPCQLAEVRPLHPPGGDGSDRDMGWPVVIITTAHETVGTERQWQNPDVEKPWGPRAHVPSHQNTPPPEWVERWRGVVASGLNTSLRLRKWETAACLRTHCISFEEEKMGNVGAVNDLCVICVARLRGCRCACASLYASKQKKKKREEVWLLISIKKIKLYLLYCKERW